MSAKSWFVAAASAVVGGVLMIGAASAGEAQPANSHPQMLPAGSSPCVFCTGMVNGDGSVARKYGVTSVTRLSEGTYDVRFAGRVSNCIWQATLADPGQGDATPGMIAVTGRGRTNNGLYLKTFAANGQPADHGFSVTTFCFTPPPP